ncbi:MAG: purine-binding chemotaxis protein CheW, partial [Anaerolineaceae bacterium]|nr:purine-binding chemotaxis protein CheW [Anaerolineaceae bacterium]
SILSFPLGDEKYGVEIKYSLGISHFDPNTFTPVPGTPDFIAGVANIRGRIYSITDLASFFGLKGSEICSTTHLLLLSADSSPSNNLVIGILTDQKPQVMHIPKVQIKASQDLVAHKGKSYIQGISDEMIIILDIKKLLQEKALIITVSD